jgi:hypothetical protein
MIHSYYFDKKNPIFSKATIPTVFIPVWLKNSQKIIIRIYVNTTLCPSMVGYRMMGLMNNLKIFSFHLIIEAEMKIFELKTSWSLHSPAGFSMNIFGARPELLLFSYPCTLRMPKSLA